MEYNTHRLKFYYSGMSSGPFYYSGTNSIHLMKHIQELYTLNANKGRHQLEDMNGIERKCKKKTRNISQIYSLTKGHL